MQDHRWPHHIIHPEYSFELVTSEKNQPFKAVCAMYQIERQDLMSELGNMMIYCIYDQEHEPIGTIQIENYPSSEALKEQISQEEKAESLFNKGQTLELSYALSEEYRGQGFGKAAITGWVRAIKEVEASSQFFAVVDFDNPASIKILEYCGFFRVGSYVHEETKNATYLYTLSP
ncbi:MAG: GNAT family protein [Chlamydiota bacterium]